MKATETTSHQNKSGIHPPSARTLRRWKQYGLLRDDSPEELERLRRENEAKRQHRDPKGTGLSYRQAEATLGVSYSTIRRAAQRLMKEGKIRSRGPYEEVRLKGREVKLVTKELGVQDT